MKRSTQDQHSIEPTNGILYDHATKAKIRKHLSDINDVITEEDIRNVQTDGLIAKPEIEEDQAAESGADELIAEEKKEDEALDKNEDGNNSSDVDNDSWNILDR